MHFQLKRVKRFHGHSVFGHSPDISLPRHPVFTAQDNSAPTIRHREKRADKSVPTIERRQYNPVKCAPTKARGIHVIIYILFLFAVISN